MIDAPSQSVAFVAAKKESPLIIYIVFLLYIKRLMGVLSRIHVVHSVKWIGAFAFINIVLLDLNQNLLYQTQFSPLEFWIHRKISI